MEKVAIEYHARFTLSHVLNVGRFIQKYPIYIIKCVCDTWSSYDISLYLEMLEEFYDYQNIKAMVTRITNQFLDQAGFAREKTDAQPKSKRLKVNKTRKEAVDPYVAHSTVSSHSHASEIGQKEQPQSQPQQPQQQPEYLTWWDPNKQTLFYIDPITGNRYLTKGEFGQTFIQLMVLLAFYRPLSYRNQRQHRRHRHHHQM